MLNGRLVDPPGGNFARVRRIAIGGGLFLIGALVMGYNLLMTYLTARREAAVLEAKLRAKMAQG